MRYCTTKQPRRKPTLEELLRSGVIVRGSAFRPRQVVDNGRELEDVRPQRQKGRAWKEMMATTTGLGAEVVALEGTTR